MFKPKHILIFPFLLNLSACATYNKHVDYGEETDGVLSGFVSYDMVANANERHNEALKQAFINVKAYGVASEKSGKYQTLTQSAFLVGGAYSAAAFLFESDAEGISRAVQDNLAGVGIVGGVLAGFNSAINSAQREELFSNARHSAICIMNNSHKISSRGKNNKNLLDDINRSKLFLSFLNVKLIGAMSETDKKKVQEWIDFAAPIVERANTYQRSYYETPDDVMLRLDELASNVTRSIKGEAISVTDAARSILRAGRDNQRHENTQSEAPPDTSSDQITAMSDGVAENFLINQNLDAMDDNEKNLMFKGDYRNVDGTLKIMTSEQERLIIEYYISSLMNLQAKLQDTATPHDLLNACTIEMTGVTVPTAEEASAG